MWLTKALSAVLAVSFSTAVQGVNSCLGQSWKCQTSSTNLYFNQCGLTDDDLPDLKACLSSIDVSRVIKLYLNNNALSTVPANLLDDMESLEELYLNNNNIVAIEDGAFKDLINVRIVYLYVNQLVTVQASLFENTVLLNKLVMNNNAIAFIEAGSFRNLASLQQLSIFSNGLQVVQRGLFDNLPALVLLHLYGNSIGSIEPGAFDALVALEVLYLNSNALATLPDGIFEKVGTQSERLVIYLRDNPELQCIPTVTSTATVFSTGTPGLCECTPVAEATCGLDKTCAPGTVGYKCLVACTDDAGCDVLNGEVCCKSKNVCEAFVEVDAGACGDPHMTGFRGQKFDFVGEDRGWYALISDLPYLHVNMRITSAVPSVPEITYITGVSITTMDVEGVEHTMVITVAEPHDLESSCGVGFSVCLANGALHVVVDGEEDLLAPGVVNISPDIGIAAVNLPGACRSFGFEKYWERKKLELHAGSDRKLMLLTTMQDMSDWVLSDPTATNKAECAEYIAAATTVGGVGLFAHQSEHASFQIMTPTAKVRLSHGKLHQLPMRDPTDTIDLPDHLAWQMNIAIDHNDMGLDATGILGETLVPTVNAMGAPIMYGMDAIRGKQEDYRVTGPLGTIFAQGQHFQ